MLYILFQCKSL